LLRQADIVFGNCEGVYADHLALSPSRRVFHGAPARFGARLAEVPFHVMNCANNHVLDGGYVGLQETLALLRGQNIVPVGAGETLAEAACAAVIERKGRRVAFLGFCAAFSVGYEARGDRPGLAPLRIRTHYSVPEPNSWDPGAEPIVTTEVERGDLAVLHGAIAAARREADIVIVSFHWGHSPEIREAMPSASTRTCQRKWQDTMADYEIDIARGAVEHGADAIFCHHHLSLRPFELHHGKPIFYGLGILVNHFQQPQLHKLLRADPAWPYFPFRKENRFSGIAVLDFDSAGAVKAGFIPAMILADGSTEPLRAGDARVDAAEVYMRHLMQLAGFETPLRTGERGGWAYFGVEG
jgi:poly-gamma-glutamate synthesis protein (capsule biosynthesis protein)